MAIRAVLVGVAAGAIVALALLASGATGAFSAGALKVTLNDFSKPLAWGVTAAAVLLWREWPVPPWRRIAGGLLLVLALLALVNVARGAPALVTDADVAITELYTELATRGRLLVGPYSRYGWNHPGPLYFYLQAPLYAASGHKAAALFVSALAINMAAILVVAWILGRENRGPLLVMATAACVLVAWRAPRLLASPWTAHVPILPALSFVVCAAAVIGGRTPLLPLATGIGSFIAQTHAAFVPLVAALSTTSVAAVLVRPAAGDRSARQALNASAWVCFALWLLPLSEALSRGGGNLGTLVRFFVTDAAAGHALQDAFMNWSYGLTGVLRPGFALPWGGHFVLQHLWWAVPCAVAQVVLLSTITGRDLRAGRRFDGALAAAALVASMVGLGALTRIRGDILDHEVFWLAALGALNLGVIGAAGLRALAVTGSTHGGSAARLALAGCVLVLAAGALLGVHHLRGFIAYELRRTGRGSIVATYEAIDAYIRREGISQVRVTVGDGAWSHAGGVLLRLVQDGTPFTVDDRALPMFTRAFESRGDEEAMVTIGTSPRPEDTSVPASHVVLRAAPPIYVDAIRLERASRRSDPKRR